MNIGANFNFMLMKRLLLILGVFSFMTVFAVSSTTVNWSGELYSPDFEVLSNTQIHCTETGSTVITNSAGVYRNLKLKANSENTLSITASSGESLGSMVVTAGSSDSSDQILVTQ